MGHHIKIPSYELETPRYDYEGLVDLALVPAARLKQRQRAFVRRRRLELAGTILAMVCLAGGLYWTAQAASSAVAHRIGRISLLP